MAAVFAVCQITPGGHTCRGVRLTLGAALGMVEENKEAGSVLSTAEETPGLEWAITDNLQVGRYWAIRFVSDGGE